jgi:hypothetical protein
MQVDMVVLDEETLIDEGAVEVTISTDMSEVVALTLTMSLIGHGILDGVGVGEVEVDISKIRVHLGHGKPYDCVNLI